MPLSFALPEELEEWREWVRAHDAAAAAPRDSSGSSMSGTRASNSSEECSSSADMQQGKGLWIMKTGQDAGTPYSVYSTHRQAKIRFV